jgi:hypothetical protein
VGRGAAPCRGTDQKRSRTACATPTRMVGEGTYGRRLTAGNALRRFALPARAKQPARLHHCGEMVTSDPAMMGNLMDYVGSFALRGLRILTSAPFLEGSSSGLNPPVLSARHGPGIGSRSADTASRATHSAASRGLARRATAHGLDSLLTAFLLGPNAVTVFAAPWACR